MVVYLTMSHNPADLGLLGESVSTPGVRRAIQLFCTPTTTDSGRDHASLALRSLQSNYAKYRPYAETHAARP